MSEPDLEIVAGAIQRGEVVILPTDTVYGLVADPRSAIAVRRLFELKGRSDEVPVAVLVASTDQALELVDAGPRLRELADRHWPGALTIVATVRPETDLEVGTAATLGVRCPDDAFVRALAERVGPLAATSANLHGRPPAVDGAAAREMFGAEVDLIIDGGPRPGRASTVVNLTGDEVEVLRVGEVHVE